MNISMNGDDAARRASSPIAGDEARSTSPQAVSALMDGQLHGTEFAQVVEAVQRDPQLRATWQTYHLVGDLLRQAEAGLPQRAVGDLAARVAARLAAEPMPGPFGPATVAVVVDPADAVARTPAAGAGAISRPAHQSPQQPDRNAANDPVWRWRAVAGVATAVAVGAVGWHLLSTAVTNPAPAPVLAKTEPPRQMLRDPRLDELLAAHEQSAGISALQMPAGFLRNATFEGRGR